MLFSKSKYPSISAVYSIFNILKEDVKAIENSIMIPEFKDLCDAIWNKLNKYTKIQEQKDLYLVAALLGPRIKLNALCEADKAHATQIFKCVISQYLAEELNLVEFSSVSSSKETK